MAAITICNDFGAQKNKVSHYFPIYLPWCDGTDAMILVFWMLSFKPTFLLYSFTFIKGAYLNMTQHFFFMKLSSQNDHDLHTQTQCQLVKGLKRQKVSQIIFLKYYYKFNLKNKPHWIKLLSYTHATKVTTKWLETDYILFQSWESKDIHNKRVPSSSFAEEAVQ